MNDVDRAPYAIDNYIKYQHCFANDFIERFFCVIIFFLKKVLVNKFFALSLHSQSRDIDCLG